MSSLTANRISADLDQFKLSMAQSQYNSGHYATVTHYRSVKPASWWEQVVERNLQGLNSSLQLNNKCLICSKHSYLVSIV